MNVGNKMKSYKQKYFGSNAFDLSTTGSQCEYENVKFGNSITTKRKKPRVNNEGYDLEISGYEMGTEMYDTASNLKAPNETCNSGKCGTNIASKMYGTTSNLGEINKAWDSDRSDLKMSTKASNLRTANETWNSDNSGNIMPSKMYGTMSNFGAINQTQSKDNSNPVNSDEFATFGTVIKTRYFNKDAYKSAKDTEAGAALLNTDLSKFDDKFQIGVNQQNYSRLLNCDAEYFMPEYPDQSEFSVTKTVLTTADSTIDNTEELVSEYEYALPSFYSTEQSSNYLKPERDGCVDVSVSSRIIGDIVPISAKKAAVNSESSSRPLKREEKGRVTEGAHGLVETGITPGTCNSVEESNNVLKLKEIIEVMSNKIRVYKDRIKDFKFQLRSGGTTGDNEFEEIETYTEEVITKHGHGCVESDIGNRGDRGGRAVEMVRREKMQDAEVQVDLLTEEDRSEAIREWFSEQSQTYVGEQKTILLEQLYETYQTSRIEFAKIIIGLLSKSVKSVMTETEGGAWMDVGCGTEATELRNMGTGDDHSVLVSVVDHRYMVHSAVSAVPITIDRGTARPADLIGATDRGNMTATPARVRMNCTSVEVNVPVRARCTQTATVREVEAASEATRYTTALGKFSTGDSDAGSTLTGKNDSDVTNKHYDSWITYSGGSDMNQPDEKMSRYETTEFQSGTTANSSGVSMSHTGANDRSSGVSMSHTGANDRSSGVSMSQSGDILFGTSRNGASGTMSESDQRLEQTLRVIEEVRRSNFDTDSIKAVYTPKFDDALTRSRLERYSMRNASTGASGCLHTGRSRSSGSGGWRRKGLISVDRYRPLNLSATRTGKLAHFNNMMRDTILHGPVAGYRDGICDEDSAGRTTTTSIIHERSGPAMNITPF